MIWWLVNSRFGRGLAAVGAALLALATMRRKWRREGAEAAIDRAEERDHANAEAMRERVGRELPDRVREFDGRGYRD